MSATAEIRSKLPLCGRCKNWESLCGEKKLKIRTEGISNNHKKFRCWQLFYDPL
jgi:hypothetical protein